MPSILNAYPLRSRHAHWRVLFSVIAVLLLTMLAADRSAAQTTSGTIRGTVYDPQQKIVPGATVVVTDEETNITREAPTDLQGFFEITNLRPGTYTVSAALSGFKKYSGREWFCGPRRSFART